MFDTSHGINGKHRTVTFSHYLTQHHTTLMYMPTWLRLWALLCHLPGRSHQTRGRRCIPFPLPRTPGGNTLVLRKRAQHHDQLPIRIVARTHNKRGGSFDHARQRPCPDTREYNEGSPHVVRILVCSIFGELFLLGIMWRCRVLACAGRCSREGYVSS